MIVLITFKDEKTNQLWVSHGVNLDSDSGMNIVILPMMPLFYYDEAKYNTDLMEYVLL